MDAQELARALGAVRSGRQWKCKCVAHEDRTPSMIIFDGHDAVQVRCMSGCDPRDIIAVLKSRGLWNEVKSLEEPTRTKRVSYETKHDKPERDRTELARWLWSQREPIEGTVASVYLRARRGITCALPATLGYLPPRGEHPAAMIAGFGYADESEPGVLTMPGDRVVAVHLTKLTPAGEKIEKIMVGSPRGAPIVLAPMNDLLGLAITEGIEDGLSIFQATGLGVWAAGSASLMGSLGDAVPDWVDCVTVLTDHADAKQAGLRGSSALIERLLERGIFAEQMPSRGGVF